MKDNYILVFSIKCHIWNVYHLCNALTSKRPHPPSYMHAAMHLVLALKQAKNQVHSTDHQNEKTYCFIGLPAYSDILGNS